MELPNKRVKQSESLRLVDFYVNRMLVVGEKKPSPSNGAMEKKAEEAEDLDEDGNDEEAEEKDNGDAAGDDAAMAAAAAPAAASQKSNVEQARRVVIKQRGPKGNGAKRKEGVAAPAAGLGLKAIVKPKSSRQQHDEDVAKAAREEEEAL